MVMPLVRAGMIELVEYAPPIRPKLVDGYRPMAARGAGFLTRVLGGPEWRPRIDLKLLDLFSGTCCVLGQLYGGYDVGALTLGLSADQEYDYGFVIDMPYRGSSWQALTEAWRQELAPGASTSVSTSRS